MASAYHVPPPPEFVDFNFSSQLTYSFQQQRSVATSFSLNPPTIFNPFSKLGGGGGQPASGGSHHSQNLPSFEGSWNNRSSKGLMQRVPETPCWKRGAEKVPNSVEGRLDFSCKRTICEEY